MEQPIKGDREKDTPATPAQGEEEIKPTEGKTAEEIQKENFKNFPIPLDQLPTRFFKPRSMFLAEIFKIVDGQILSIEALMVNAPFGAVSGWTP